MTKYGEYPELEEMMNESVERLKACLDDSINAYDYRPQQIRSKYDLPIRLTTELDDIFHQTYLRELSVLGVDITPATKEVSRGILRKAYDFLTGRKAKREYVSVQLKGSSDAIGLVQDDLRKRRRALWSNTQDVLNELLDESHAYQRDAEEYDGHLSQISGEMYEKTHERFCWLLKLESLESKWSSEITDRFVKVFMPAIWEEVRHENAREDPPRFSVYKTDNTVN